MVRKRTGLENRQQAVIADLLAGQTCPAVARTYGVTESAVRHFRERHADILIPAREAAVAQTVHLWIADEVARQERRQELYEQTDQKRRELPERNGMTYAALTREQRQLLQDAEPKTERPIEVFVGVSLAWSDGSPA